MHTRVALALVLCTMLVAAVGCAPTPDTVVTTPGTDQAAAGFWRGLWHGFILLFTFVVSLFNDSVGIYEAHNNGNLYNLGFLLGVMIFFGGSSGGACTKRK